MYNHVPILVVGNVTHDTLISNHNQKKRCLGGGVAYISRVLSGLNIPYAVISNVGYDFKYLHECTFTPIVYPRNKTTEFINYIQTVPRKQKIMVSAPPISPHEITYTSQITIVSSVINEIPFSTMKKLRNKSQILIGDIQGFIRMNNLDNNITIRPINNTSNTESILMFDYIKLNQEELNYIDLISLTSCGIKVLITCAANGCYLYNNGACIHVPAYPSSCIDDTGAGDCFLAGFVVGMYNNLPIYESMKLGHKCALIAIQSLGIPSVDKFKLIQV